MIAATGMANGRYDGLLSEVEEGRWRRYRRAADRERFAVGVLVLKRAVAAWLGVAADDVAVDRTCGRCGEQHGRPRIEGADHLYVSVSHSRDVVAVALTEAGPVGVDVEAVTGRDYGSMVDAVCAPDERPHVQSSADFITYWVRKEALLKAVGVGLEVPMGQVRVTPPTVEPALVSYRGEPLEAQMADFTPAADYAGCVTVLTTQPLDVSLVESAR